MKKYRLFILIWIFLIAGISSCKTDGFKKIEIERIRSGGENAVMPLFTINEKRDSLLLRQIARKVRKRDIHSESLELLRRRMLATVNDSLNPGVGIAAPQVGISIQMIYVQRLDKPGEPFEIYYNPEIKYYSDTTALGREGCLSVPFYRGMVRRSQEIRLSYLDSLGHEKNEEINNFTAVIFQHEIDHINGVLYYDHVKGGFDALTKIDEF